jgi:patatin-like phospholipase/acyl hydrolase
LDGGGVLGIFTAALLAGLEDDLDRSILDSFDLVVGTSTGGVIALGLGAGLTPREILNFYVTERRAIFPDHFGWRGARKIFRAKYSSAPLEAALRGVLGEKLLGESRVPLVIPSYDLGEDDVYLFKTPHHLRLRRDHRQPMWSVAMATAAAPTYFPAFRLPGEHVRLIDGGVWANNPAMVGVAEAVSMFGAPLEEIRVLSLGTTAKTDVRSPRLDNSGILRWIRAPNVVDVFLRGQSTGAFAQVRHLIGEHNAYRLDPPGPEGAALDCCSAEELVAKAAHHSRQFSPVFESHFAPHQPRPYQPLAGPFAKKGVVADVYG